MPARFLYARFSAADQRAVANWLRSAEDIVSGYGGSAAVRLPVRAAAPVGPAFAWRLVSENRREVARGCRLFATEHEARADTVPLLCGASSLVVHAAPGPRIRSTGWFVTSGGEVVMMGARRYESRSTALSAGAIAVRLVAELAEAGPAGPDPLDEAAGEFVR